jgi:hypothetical protein
VDQKERRKSSEEDSAAKKIAALDPLNHMRCDAALAAATGDHQDRGSNLIAVVEPRRTSRELCAGEEQLGDLMSS